MTNLQRPCTEAVSVPRAVFERLERPIQYSLLREMASRGDDGMVIVTGSPGVDLDRAPSGFAYVRGGYTETDKDRAFLYSQGW